MGINKKYKPETLGRWDLKDVMFIISSREEIILLPFVY